MREIKFRAWDGLIMYEPMTLNTISHGITKKVQWLQYTGLKDKNGVEIYEGDRLEYQPDIGEDFTRDRYTVKWHNRGFVAAWDGDKDCNNSDNDGLIGGPKLVDMVVIGNIHENPELLEAEL